MSQGPHDVFEEKRQLDTRLLALAEYVGSTDYDVLPLPEQHLLTSKMRVMWLYNRVLEEEISLMGTPLW